MEEEITIREENILDFGDITVSNTDTKKEEAIYCTSWKCIKNPVVLITVKGDSITRTYITSK